MRVLVTDGGAIYQTTKKQNGRLDNNNRLNVTNETIQVVMEYMRNKCLRADVEHIEMITEHGAFVFYLKGDEY